MMEKFIPTIREEYSVIVRELIRRNKTFKIYLMEFPFCILKKVLEARQEYLLIRIGEILLRGGSYF